MGGASSTHNTKTKTSIRFTRDGQTKLEWTTIRKNVMLILAGRVMIAAAKLLVAIILRDLAA